MGALAISESIPLTRFLFEPEWVPVQGTYLYPLRVLQAEERPREVNDYLEVVTVVDVGGRRVAVTRGGGMFLRARVTTDTWAEAVEVTRILNLLVCELTLHGLISEPVSTAHIQAGKLIGRHIAIPGGWGDFAERNWGVLALLASPIRDMGPPYRSGNPWWTGNFYYVPHSDPTLLSAVRGMHLVRQLLEASTTLPAFIASAYYNADRHNLAEAAVSAWISTEQILSHYWREYVASIDDAQRRRRLMDYRSYISSIQLEILDTISVFPSALAKKVHVARKARNELAHYGKLEFSDANACLTAMHAMIEFFCGTTLPNPVIGQASGGVLTPSVIPESVILLD